MQIDENPMRIDGNPWKSFKTEGGGQKSTVGWFPDRQKSKKSRSRRTNPLSWFFMLIFLKVPEHFEFPWRRGGIRIGVFSHESAKINWKPACTYIIYRHPKWLETVSKNRKNTTKRLHFLRCRPLPTERFRGGGALFKFWHRQTWGSNPSTSCFQAPFLQANSRSLQLPPQTS